MCGCRKAQEITYIPYLSKSGQMINRWLLRKVRDFVFDALCAKTRYDTKHFNTKSHLQSTVRVELNGILFYGVLCLLGQIFFFWGEGGYVYIYNLEVLILLSF